jgi:hypothetical protein
MKQNTISGTIIGYLWRLGALGAIYFVGVGLMFILFSRLGNVSYEDTAEGGLYPLVFIIPALPIIFLSWIFHSKEIGRTVRFWLITAAVVLVIWALSLVL